jgi:hypothetical protein
MVDLVPGVTRYEQHSSGFDAVYHIVNGDRAVS